MCVSKFARIIPEQREVVDVTEIAARPQPLSHVVIELVEIHIREELAGEVSDRQTAPSFDRGQQIIARKVEMNGFLRIGPVDNPIEQPQRRCAGDTSAEVPFQDRVIDGGKISVDVAAQHMTRAVAELLIPRHAGMGSFADAVGETVIDEATLEDWLDDMTERMMDDTVSKRSGGDTSRLRILDLDHRVFPRRPTLFSQLSFEAQAFSFQMSHERSGPGRATLAFHGAFGGRDEGGEAGDLIEEIIEAACAFATSSFPI